MDITAESDGLTETVTDAHMLLIMVRLQRLRKNAGNTLFRG